MSNRGGGGFEISSEGKFTIFLFIYFFASAVGFSLSTLRFFLHYYTMILQRIRISVGDAGFEPGGPLLHKSGAPHMYYALGNCK